MLYQSSYYTDADVQISLRIVLISAKRYRGSAYYRHSQSRDSLYIRALCIIVRHVTTIMVSSQFRILGVLVVHSPDFVFTVLLVESLCITLQRRVIA